MDALSEISDRVEGKLHLGEKENKVASVEKLRSVLENNEAGVQEVGIHLAHQLKHADKESDRKRAIDTILEVYGVIGTSRNQDSADRISIVVHNTVNHTDMFPRRVAEREG